MRISNNYMMAQSLVDLNNNQVRIDQTQEDISTGVRIHLPQDDPTANARAMVLNENLSQNAQYQTNIDNAKNYLSVTDSTMNSVLNVMQQLRDLAVRGQNGDLEQPDRDAINQQVLQLKSQLIDLGNTQVQGRFIFGGIKTQDQPYPPTDVTLSPNDTGALTTEVGQGITVQYNVTGVSVFGDTTPPDTTSVFAMIDQFSGYLESGTNTTDISDSTLPQMDQFITSMSEARTQVGGTLARLDTANSRLSDEKINLQSLLNDTQSTDIAKATLDLNQSQAAYQAALAVAARALPLSLVDYLK
ncbi:MAG TPA: flagellar hook-associated protein FlgL [Oscillatoriaceae cyanobacterium]